MQEETITARLENWAPSIYRRGALCGDIHDDMRKRWVDGTPITTSVLPDGLDSLQEGMVVKTTYSTYLLGKPFESNNTEIL